MNNENYIDIVNNYINESIDKQDNNNSCFYNRVFFTYPSKKLDRDMISDIIGEISNEIKIPYHDIKIIGSSHLGFSLVKPYNTNEIKLFNSKTSDIDFAIINKSLFYELFSKTLEETSFYTDLTKFANPKNYQYYMSHIALGFIRPDTIGSVELRVRWLRFFKDLSNEYNLKISAAIYLDEKCFHQRMEKAFKIYTERMGFCGTK
ncbi:hypothetical protein EXM99_09185 [Clostridium botulinum]|nr:hypothetical protein [Clostridium botulinum]